MREGAGRRVRVAVHGGCLPLPPEPLALADGTVVEFLPGRSRLPEVHGHLLLDGAACDRERHREEPERRIGWLVESPAFGFADRAARYRDSFRLLLTSDADLLAAGPPCRFLSAAVATVGPVSPRKDRLVSMTASLENRFAGHHVRLACLARARVGGVDCFGRGHRPVASLHEALDAYAFAVVVENCRRDFYFSEKLVDCLLTETVPVYWGLPSLGRFLDPRGVIPFDRPEDLDAVLPALTPARYEAMRPHVLENKRRALALLDGTNWPGAAREVAAVLGDLAPRRPAPWRRWDPLRRLAARAETRRRRGARRSLAAGTATTATPPPA